MAGHLGGKKAWKGMSKAEKSRIMSERNRKRWAAVKANGEKNKRNG